jgi:hypothetical protein
VVRPVRRRTRTARGDTEFPKALVEWIAKDGTLLDALLALRLRAEGRDALQTVLAIRRVAALKASWALWEALTEGDGEDPEGLLLRALPLSQVEEARSALWGSSWRDREEAQLHQGRRANLRAVSSR